MTSTTPRRATRIEWFLLLVLIITVSVLVQHAVGDFGIGVAAALGVWAGRHGLL